MRPRSHPRSPVQAVRTRWWAPFLLAFVAAGAIWTGQQVRRAESQPPEPAPVEQTATEQGRVPASPVEDEQPPTQVAERAEANLALLFSTDDYPVEAIRREEQGTTAFKLSVNNRGRVERCAIVRSSGSQALDRTTCEILSKRARFTPATNEQGQPVADISTGRIRWVLPEG